MAPLPTANPRRRYCDDACRMRCNRKRDADNASDLTLAAEIQHGRVLNDVVAEHLMRRPFNPHFGEAAGPGAKAGGNPKGTSLY